MTKHQLCLRALKLWRRHLKPFVVMVLILCSFRSAIADWNDVPTGSMNPTILEGDRIFVNKLAYGLKIPFTTWHLLHWNEPQRGEIVVFNSPADGTRLVKRVVGLPGDLVQMIDNRLLINGQPLHYTTSAAQITEQLGPTNHKMQLLPRQPAMRNFGPIRVPAGEYFMMGDNRDNSYDSRYIGTVKLDQIVGRSSSVAFSLNYDRYFLPRLERFFKSLD
jgi:signal peptidase I